MGKKQKRKSKERIDTTFGHRVTKTKDNPFGWEVVDITEIDTKKPVILCFGGNGSTSDRVANGSAKLIEQLLGIKQEDDYIDTYVINYGGFLSTNQNYEEDDGRNPPVDEKMEVEVGNLTEDEKKEIMENLFLPLVKNEEGQRYTAEEASKNMRNINIFSYCYGAEVIENIINSLTTQMARLNYDKNETGQILSQILQVSYSPLKENKYSTNFMVKSFKDGKLGLNYKTDFAESQGELFDLDDESFQPYLGCGEFCVKGNTVNLYSASLIGEGTNEDEHVLTLIGRDRNWNNKFSRADAASKCMAFTLALGVTNSIQNQNSEEFQPLPSADEIMDLNKYTIDSENKTVKEKKHKEKYDELNM